jgi:hypothetical protein
MPFYQPPHRVTFASTFRSFAQDPGLPVQQALPQPLIERLAAEEAVHFAEDADDVFTPAVTLWAFLTQCLSDTKSCVAAVSRVMVWCVSVGRRVCSAATGAYCKARAKLPLGFLRRLTYHLGGAVEEQAAPE